MDSEFQKSCSTDFSEENWGHISPGRYCWTEGMHTYTWIYIHYYNTYYRVNDSSLLYILIVLVTLSFSTLFYRVLFPCPGGLHGKYSCKHVSAIEKSMIKPWDFNSFFFFFFPSPSSSQLVKWALECSWSDSLVELQTLTRLTYFAYVSHNYEIVTTCSKRILQSDENFFHNRDTKKYEM